jgi:hypothetical protein
MTLLNALPSEGALDQSGQLTGSAVHSLDHGVFLVSHRDGLAAFEAGFHHAALVFLGALVAALVAQVDFHSRDVIAQMAQSTLHDATDLGGQSLVTFDVMVGTDLDLHIVLPLWW